MKSIEGAIDNSKLTNSPGIKNMKNSLLVMLIVFLSMGSAWSGDFEDTKKLAEPSNSIAQFYLGLMYYLGKGVTQDYKQAVYWYTKAAEQGYPKAQFNLALMYDDGKGVTQDYKQAVYWYTKAAEQGRS